MDRREYLRKRRREKRSITIGFHGKNKLKLKLLSLRSITIGFHGKNKLVLIVHAAWMFSARLISEASHDITKSATINMN